MFFYCNIVNHSIFWKELKKESSAPARNAAKSQEKTADY